jgi:hypothetical protein
MLGASRVVALVLAPVVQIVFAGPRRIHRGTIEGRIDTRVLAMPVFRKGTGVGISAECPTGGHAVKDLQDMLINLFYLLLFLLMLLFCGT